MSAPPAVSSRRVFVDTGAYYALADADDADHRQALAVARRIQAALVRDRVLRGSTQHGIGGSGPNPRAQDSLE